MVCRLCQNYVFVSTSIFLENLLSASTCEIRVDVYERQLAFSRRRLVAASTFKIRVDVYERQLAFSRRRLASTLSLPTFVFRVDVRFPRRRSKLTPPRRRSLPTSTFQLTPTFFHVASTFQLTPTSCQRR